MPTWPEEAREVALAALDNRAMSDGLDISTRQAWQLVTDILDAAAPILAETVAQKITVHMEGFGPHRPSGALEPVTAIGRDYRAWRRHFGIAARVAAGAFYTDEDKMRLAAEAIARGDFIISTCPEVPGE